MSTMGDLLGRGNARGPKLTKPSPSGALGRVLDPRFGDVYRGGRFRNVGQPGFRGVDRTDLLIRHDDDLPRWVVHQPAGNSHWRFLRAACSIKSARRGPPGRYSVHA
jgi:hypothetical protein